MAKPATIQIKLESTAGTGYFYTTKKNPVGTFTTAESEFDKLFSE